MAANDFEVFIASETADGATVVTSPSDFTNERLRKVAMAAYDPKNDSYSSYLNEGETPASSLSISDIDTMLTNTQNDLSKVRQIAAYNRKLVNMDDIVGKTVESIETNINTEIKIIYPEAVTQSSTGRNKKKRLEGFKTFINNINTGWKLKGIVRDSITTAYMEGNYVCYLRHEDPTNYQIDVYPLGLVEISDYTRNGEPVVLLNINELRTRLQKTYKKNKKNKALFYDLIDSEVKATYPAEVYQAFRDKEQYAVLDPNYTGVIRVNNMGRRYGVSPIARAYRDLNMLDTFRTADRITSKARAKKIIHQKMRKETMGAEYNKDFYPELVYAHQNFMEAYKQATVVVTSPPTVEEIRYVEPTVEMTSKDTYNTYRSNVLATLGVQFLMDSGSQSVSTASISITQLMRTINKISEKLEDVLQKFYRQIIIDNNYPLEYSPVVKILDSEMLEQEMKKDLATLVFSTLNGSYTTAFDILGIDVNDEISKRQYENEMGYDDVFKPHGSQYTNSSGGSSSEGGRPTGTDEEKSGKQAYDKERNSNLG